MNLSQDMSTQQTRIRRQGEEDICYLTDDEGLSDSFFSLAILQGFSFIHFWKLSMAEGG